MKYVSIKSLCTIALLSILAVGCSSKQGPPTEDQATFTKLNEFGELYRVYSNTYKKPPKSKAEAAKVENSVPSGLTSINNGDIVGFWGAELTDLTEEPGPNKSDKILAYEKDVPTKGGNVLTLDRRVKKMTAEEFASAPKAGTTEPEKAPAKK